MNMKNTKDVEEELESSQNKIEQISSVGHKHSSQLSRLKENSNELNGPEKNRARNNWEQAKKIGTAIKATGMRGVSSIDRCYHIQRAFDN